MSDDQNSKIDIEAAKIFVVVLFLIAFGGIAIGFGYTFGAWAGWLLFGVGTGGLAIRFVKYIEAHK